MTHDTDGWQAANGDRPNHGKAFREQAARLGIEPSASERLTKLPSRKRCHLK